jgi:hypothetical protein
LRFDLQDGQREGHGEHLIVEGFATARALWARCGAARYPIKICPRRPGAVKRH